MKKQITPLLIFILFCPQLFVLPAKGEGLFNGRQKGWNPDNADSRSKYYYGLAAGKLKELAVLRKQLEDLR